MPTNHPNDPDNVEDNAAMERFIHAVAGYLLIFEYGLIDDMCDYDFLDWFGEHNVNTDDNPYPKYGVESRAMYDRCSSFRLYVFGLAVDFAEWIAEDDDTFFTKLDRKYRMEQDNG